MFWNRPSSALILKVKFSPFSLVLSFVFLVFKTENKWRLLPPSSFSPSDALSFRWWSPSSWNRFRRPAEAGSLGIELLVSSFFFGGSTQKTFFFSVDGQWRPTPKKNREKKILTGRLHLSANFLRFRLEDQLPIRKNQKKKNFDSISTVGGQERKKKERRIKSTCQSGHHLWLFFFWVSDWEVERTPWKLFFFWFLLLLLMLLSFVEILWKHADAAFFLSHVNFGAVRASSKEKNSVKKKKNSVKLARETVTSSF